MKIYTDVKIIPTKKKGDSWPVIVKTEDGNYLVKLAGSGHGIPALISEIISSNIAKFLGIKVPDLALIEINDFNVDKRQDPELISLLKASKGLNVGCKIISGARDFQLCDMGLVSEWDSNLIFWFDWFVMNPDRTVNNPNIMIKNGKLWLIDHGSSLMFQHNWADLNESSPNAFWKYGKEHVFFKKANTVYDLHNIISSLMTRDQVRRFIDIVPTSYYKETVPCDHLDAVVRRKESYTAFLWKRLKAPINY